MHIKRIIISLVFLYCSANAWSDSSNDFLSSFYRFDYNYINGITNELFFEGHYSYSDHFSIYGGFSTAFHTLPERYFLRASVNGFPHFLEYSITFLGREFTEYEITENSIYPTIKFITRFVDVEAGLGMRFLGGMDESFTVSTLYNLKIKFFDREKFKLSYTIKNFDHFYSSNITDMSHNLDSEIMFFDSFNLLIGLGVTNPGQVGFTSFISGFYGNLGIKYSYAH
ncbi:hypothetical protein [Spirochaeta isovalerica]|uniref:Uncharacterized protein n=1 Tax=Spirochaeta isovalerica TaxID=150 RepID=A0A841RDR9_9SPIO|nr:hypothetical protein [Spirochaeta isovalerica]MBB6481367.1 hypothetical protein [Spirochaeta isovalerica]